MHRGFLTLSAAAAVASFAVPLHAQAADTPRVGYSAGECPSCAEWNAPARPVHLYGSAYWVGPRGLGAILLATPAGHLLIDAGLPESAGPIMANIRALGFRVEDIRVIVNSHAHFDHAGGIAAIQRASGARVAASPASAAVLRRGTAGPDDPQYGIALAYPAVTGTRIRELADGDTLQVGPIVVTAHFTPGHTRGGTSWSWRDCEAKECLDVVYADSQTPVSADGFLFTHSVAYPTVLQDFARSFALLEQLPCDVLLTPHPGASRMWERLEARERGERSALRDPGACRRYAASAREQLARRVVAEGTGR